MHNKLELLKSASQAHFAMRHGASLLKMRFTNDSHPLKSLVPFIRT